VIFQSDLPYLAGIMDGESTFLIAKRKKNNGYIYSSTFSISMIDEYPIKLIAEFFNLPYSVRINKLNKKQVYYLFVSSKKAEYIAETMVEFLRVKKAQAECLLEYRNLRKDKKKYLITKNYKVLHAKYGGDRMIPNKIPSSEYYELCEKIRQKCKLLKS